MDRGSGVRPGRRARNERASRAEPQSGPERLHATPYPIGETVIGNLLPNDRTWHNGHTRQQLSVTLDDSGTVTWTSVLGQTRTVTPYDYRLEPDDPPSADPVADAAPDDDPPPF